MSRASLILRTALLFLFSRRHCCHFMFAENKNDSSLKENNVIILMWNFLVYDLVQWSNLGFLEALDCWFWYALQAIFSAVLNPIIYYSFQREKCPFENQGVLHAYLPRRWVVLKIFICIWCIKLSKFDTLKNWSKISSKQSMCLYAFVLFLYSGSISYFLSLFHTFSLNS